MSKKVLEISVRADVGGGPKHLLDLLTHNNSNVQLHSAIPHGYEYSKKIISASTDSIEVPHRSFSFVTLFKLISFCKKHDIRTVHSHGRGAGYYSRMMKFFGFKVIHTLHGVHIEDGLVNKIKLFIDQLLVPLTDTFICVSNGEKEKAKNYKVINAKKVEVVFNGILPQNPSNFTSEIPKIAMLGRLSYPKGYDLLIDQIEKFCLTSPELKFEINIAGDGEDKEKFLLQLEKTKLAKNHISFIGQTNSPIEFLKEHTHFLSFSRFEGMPISVLEAMSVGLPCMVSDVVGNFDIINEKNGILFDQTNFKEKFKSFLIDNHSQKIQSELKDINEKFNIKKQVLITTKVY